MPSWEYRNERYLRSACTKAACGFFQIRPQVVDLALSHFNFTPLKLGSARSNWILSLTLTIHFHNPYPTILLHSPPSVILYTGIICDPWINCTWTSRKADWSRSKCPPLWQDSLELVQRNISKTQMTSDISTPISVCNNSLRLVPSRKYIHCPEPVPSFASCPSLSITKSNLFGPDSGADSHICLFGGCLLRIYVPFGVLIVRMPACAFRLVSSKVW
jgi:hypothetical protein